MDHKDDSTEFEVENINRKLSIDNPQNEYIPDTEEEKKLVRKIDLFLLPAIWLMYLLSYMDRTK